MLSASKIVIRSARSVKINKYHTRLFHASVLRLGATKFAMPAMSPTMDKGGIVEWKVKEGEAYSAGDVLLEVETDKAQIDVEAQDDGILAKILSQNGAKDIPVGKTIAYLAEPEDDISRLEFPEEDAVETPAAPEASKKEVKEIPAPKKSSSTTSTGIFNKANPDQTFFPSVHSLLEANGISKEEALNKIEATGPEGRILKGDVLYYLGKISKDDAGAIATYFSAHEKLDLSNIQAAPIKAEAPLEEVKSEKSADSEATSAPVPPPEPKIISQSFDLSPIIKLREETLGKVKPFTVYEFVNEAVQKAEAYALQRHAVKSDYYDDLFEDIVSLPTKLDRFKVNFVINYNESKPASLTPSTPSIFDLLTDIKSTPAAEESHELPTVTVSLKINEKVADAEDKAKLFIEKFDELLSI